MEYTCETIINQPIDKVVDLFSNPDNLKHWQAKDGFKSITLISGVSGEEGSKSMLRYEKGNKVTLLEQTIITNNLPDEFRSKYYIKGIHTEIANRFLKVDAHQTKYVCEHKVRFDPPLKWFAWMFKGAAKKQFRKFMMDFKAFAEKS